MKKQGQSVTVLYQLEILLSRDFTRPDLPTGETELPPLPDLSAYGMLHSYNLYIILITRSSSCSITISR